MVTRVRDTDNTFELSTGLASERAMTKAKGATRVQKPNNTITRDSNVRTARCCLKRLVFS